MIGSFFGYFGMNIDPNQLVLPVDVCILEFCLPTSAIVYMTEKQDIYTHLKKIFENDRYLFD